MQVHLVFFISSFLTATGYKLSETSTDQKSQGAETQASTSSGARRSDIYEDTHHLYGGYHRPSDDFDARDSTYLTGGGKSSAPKGKKPPKVYDDGVVEELIVPVDASGFNNMRGDRNPYANAVPVVEETIVPVVAPKYMSSKFPKNRDSIHDYQAGYSKHRVKGYHKSPDSDYQSGHVKHFVDGRRHSNSENYDADTGDIIYTPHRRGHGSYEDDDYESEGYRRSETGKAKARSGGSVDKTVLCKPSTGGVSQNRSPVASKKKSSVMYSQT
ncbi:hypothetical protein RF11_12301 [Thelohanellus kitauei]|uniref:Uncharacterized protein n=1 Tax=Thelohanellus kitauei TaxID=669202 RepID=A0A0C2JU74_THEKT|nr:hypothetical protein RF11_12301 [Thelohanellus kitauei]